MVRVVRGDSYTEASLLQHFCSRMRQCYSHSHTSIATSRRRIIAWKRQGAFLLDYYDTLLETCHTRKDQFWAKLLRALRHQLKPALTQVAAELLRENRFILEDLFRAAAATVHHLQKRSQPCGPQTSNPKRCPIVPLLTFPEKSLPAQVVYPHPDSQYCPFPFCPLCMYAVPFGTKVIHVVMCTVGVWQEEGPVTHQHYRTVHALATGRCKVDRTLTELKGWVHRRCTTLGSRCGGHDADELRGAHLRARSVWQ